MTTEQAILVQRLKENLPEIRKIAGWTGVELGNMLGLSRQAVNMLEKRTSNLTLAQYIAIRHLLDAWMKIHSENTVLPRITTLLLDDMRIFGHEYIKLQEVARTIAATASGGAEINALNVIGKVLIDEWEFPAREYCYKQLEEPMIAEKIGVTADTQPGDWTEIIISGRKKTNEKR